MGGFDFQAAEVVDDTAAGFFVKHFLELGAPYRVFFTDLNYRQVFGKIPLQVLYDFLKEYIGIFMDHRVIAEGLAGNRTDGSRGAVAALQVDQEHFQR